MLSDLTLKHFNIDSEEAFFWGVHDQGEIDLFWQKNGKRFGVEFKFTSSPKPTPSMNYALKYLNLNKLICVHPGEKNFSLTENIFACSLSKLDDISLV